VHRFGRAADNGLALDPAAYRSGLLERQDDDMDGRAFHLADASGLSGVERWFAEARACCRKRPVKLSSGGNPVRFVGQGLTRTPFPRNSATTAEPLRRQLPGD